MRSIYSPFINIWISWKPISHHLAATAPSNYFIGFCILPRDKGTVMKKKIRGRDFKSRQKTELSLKQFYFSLEFKIETWVGKKMLLASKGASCCWSVDIDFYYYVIQPESMENGLLNRIDKFVEEIIDILLGFVWDDMEIREKFNDCANYREIAYFIFSGYKSPLKHFQY